MFIGNSAIQAQTRTEYAALSNRISDWITTDKTDSIVPYFDSVMKRAVSASQLADTWTTILMNWGPMVSKDKMVIEQLGEYTMVTQIIHFNRTKYKLHITYDKQFKIAGLFLTLGAQQYEVPPYVNTLNFVEYKLTFGKEPIILNGLLSIKQTTNRMPLLIIIQGSGPQDQDGTYGSNKIYKDIAWGIATNDIAVFRYPKRTSIYGSLYLSGRTDIQYTLEDEYVTDLVNAIQLLCKRNDIDTNNIFLLGHSQGGDAAVIAAKKTGKIKGIIMASTSPRHIQDIMCEQLDYINGYEPYYSAKRIQSDEMKSKLVYSLNPDLKLDAPFDSLPLNIAPSYWIYLNQLNLIDSLKTMSNLKLFFVQGKRDYQVTLVDLGEWQKAFKDDARATFKVYPYLNHMYFRGTSRSTAVEYDERHNVDEEIVSDIVKWIKNNTE